MNQPNNPSTPVLAQKILELMLKEVPGLAVLVFDKDLRFTYANGRSLRDAGYKVDEMIGQTLFEVVPAERAARLEIEYHRVLAGQSFVFPFQSEHGFYQCRFLPLRDDNLQVSHGMIVIFEDLKAGTSDL